MNDQNKKYIILGITAVILIAAVLVPVFVNRQNATEPETSELITESTTEKVFEEETESQSEFTPTFGSCGEGAMWRYIKDEKRLTISGYGKIDDSSEWSSFASDIINVWVEEDITDFDVSVFDELINAENFYFSSSVNDDTVSEFRKSEYYLNRAGREDGVLYRDNVLVEVDPSISGVFKVKDGTVEIGDGAFVGTNVTKIIIPDTVTRIGSRAFGDCIYLEEIVIGSGLDYSSCEDIFGTEDTEIHPALGAVSLKKITVSPSNETLSSEDGVLYDKNKAELIWYPAAKSQTEFSVPESVTKISSFAFTNTAYLEKIFIGKNVRSIEIFAIVFYNGYDYDTSEITGVFDIYYEGTEEEWEQISADAFPSIYIPYPTVYFNCNSFSTGVMDFLNFYN